MRKKKKRIEKYAMIYMQQMEVIVCRIAMVCRTRDGFSMV